MSEAIGLIGAAGINAYGANQAASNNQKSIQEGEDKQLGWAQAMGLSQYRTGQDLQSKLPNLLQMYSKNAPDPNQYFNPQKTNQYYNQATNNLNQNVGAQVNQAQGQAGEYAAAHGFANPGAFTFGQGNAVRQSFAPQYGQIEQGRAGALANLDSQTYAALAQQALQKSQFGQQDYTNQVGIANFSGGYNPNYFVPDYFMNMHRNGT